MQGVAVLKRVYAFLRPEAPLAVMLLALDILLAALQVGEPVLFGHLIDALARLTGGLRPHAFALTAKWLWLWGALGLASAAANMSVALLADRMGHRRKNGALLMFFKHVISLPEAFYRENHSARLFGLMFTATEQMIAIWLATFREYAPTVFSICLLVPVALVMNRALGLLLFSLLLSYSVLWFWVVGATDAAQAEAQAAGMRVGEAVGDVLGNITLVQSFLRSKLEIDRVEEAVQALVTSQLPVLKLWAAVAVTTRIASGATVIALFGVGTWLYAAQRASIGDVVTSISFAAVFIARLEQLMSFGSRFALNIGSLKEFFEVLDLSDSLTESPLARPITNVQGRVKFDHVSVSYGDNRMILDDVSFEVAPGTTVAIVGHTGSGKTTAMSLISRFRDPEGGRILIDGFDIRDATLSSVRAAVGVVFQDNPVFNRSLEDNIAFGRENATRAEVDDVVNAAQLSQFVARCHAGLDTLVGERGAKLSGGERQRVGIARAMLKDAPIMIYDEATSALDAATEREIQRIIGARHRKKTTFIIAHRLSTIRDADTVIMLEDGKIAETGSYTSLIERNGAFARMVELQLL